MKQYRVFVALLSGIVLGGCASAPPGSIVVNYTTQLPSIHEEYANQLSALKTGMPLEDFLQIIPEAYVAGQSGKTTAYELIYTQRYVTQDDIDYHNFVSGFGSPKARTTKQTLWFYFYGDKLVKWGRPQDWPEYPYATPKSIETEEDKRVSAGTGFAILENGFIVTAYHLIKGAKTTKVYMSKDSFISARMLHGDPANDLAVLKVEKPTPNFLQLAQMRSVKTGDRVFTIGFPVSSILGREPKYAEGVISSVSGIEDSASFLQITVPVQPGNSGGPLVNENGEVVGIITSTAAILPFIKESGTLPQNVNWAVKADYLRPLIELPKVTGQIGNREEIVNHVKKSTFFIETE